LFVVSIALSLGWWFAEQAWVNSYYGFCNGPDCDQYQQGVDGVDIFLLILICLPLLALLPGCYTLPLASRSTQDNQYWLRRFSLLAVILAALGFIGLLWDSVAGGLTLEHQYYSLTQLPPDQKEELWQQWRVLVVLFTLYIIFHALFLLVLVYSAYLAYQRYKRARDPEVVIATSPAPPPAASMDPSYVGATPGYYSAHNPGVPTPEQQVHYAPEEPINLQQEQPQQPYYYSPHASPHYSPHTSPSVPHYQPQQYQSPTTPQHYPPQTSPTLSHYQQASPTLPHYQQAQYPQNS